MSDKPVITIIPPHLFQTAPGGAPSRQTLAGSAADQERVQLQVAAAGEVELLFYGEQRIGARIGYPVVDTVGYLLVPCYLGIGEIGGIDSIEIDNETLPSGVTHTDYTGAAGQVANILLVNAWGYHGKVFTDAHTGKAYSVLRFPPGPEYGFNNIVFKARGKKVYDPRKYAPSLAPWGSPLGAAVSFGGGTSPAQQRFGTGSFTVEGWFYHDSFTYPNSFFPVTAFNSGGWNTAAGWGFGAGYNPSGLFVSLHDGVHWLNKYLVHENGSKPVELENQWVHVAVVVDRASEHVRVLVNGVRQTDTMSLAGSPSFGSVTNTDGFVVGNAVGWTLDGRFAELRMWNTARTDNEVRAMMFARSTGAESGLVACYPLTEGSGAAGADITSYATSRTFSITPSWGRGPDIGPASNSTKTYTDCPALCSADLITSSTYGQGLEVDWPSFGALADLNDALVGTVPNTEKRRRLALTLAAQQRTDQWVETLRSYAGCWFVEVDGRIRAVPDEAASSVMTLSYGSYILDTLSISQVGPENAPTVVTVQYTDHTSTPWNTEATQQYMRAGVSAGTVPYRESNIQWPGCPSAGMAYREAFRRGKQALLCDIDCRITLTDLSILLYRGLVVTLTDAEGFSSKPFRVMDLQLDNLGRPTASLSEYDAGVFSDEYVAGPSNPDTNLPSPNSPVAPTALVLTEELVQQQGSGLYNSRIAATWTAPTFPFITEYRVEVTLAGVVQETSTSKDAAYQTGILKEGVLYAVNVYTVSITGKVSTALQATITLEGKDDVPSDVELINARELGGKCFFDWPLVDDLDNAGYELRYLLQSVATGVTETDWGSAALLDTVPTRSARYVTDELAAGEWRVYIKARDGKRTTAYPGGQYSSVAVYVDVEVTLDSNQFLSEVHVFTGETLVNMTSYTTRPVEKTYFVTDFGDPLSYGHSNPSDATGTFGDLLAYPFAYPHSAPGSPTPESIYTTEAHDFGALISGTWAIKFEYYQQDLSAPAPILEVLTSTDGSVYDVHLGEQWTGATRFVKARIRTTGTMLVVRDVQSPRVTVSAVSRSEQGFEEGLASGGALIQLDEEYSFGVDLQLTALNTGGVARQVIADRLLLHPETGLMHQLNYNGSGDNYSYWAISIAARVVLAGDYLEYDVYIDPSTPTASGGSNGGFYIGFTDASNTGAAVADDGYSLALPATAFDALARGQWRSRRASLAAFAGKTTNAWLLLQGADSPTGTAKMLYRNIRISNSVGVTQLQVWSSGEPTFNGSVVNALVTAEQVGPSNSFKLYVFNGTGTQVAQTGIETTRWAFKGI